MSDCDEMEDLPLRKTKAQKALQKTIRGKGSHPANDLWREFGLSRRVYYSRKRKGKI